MTTAEKIRQMTDDELACFIDSVVHCDRPDLIGITDIITFLGLPYEEKQNG